MLIKKRHLLHFLQCFQQHVLLQDPLTLYHMIKFLTCPNYNYLQAATDRIESAVGKGGNAGY